MTKDFYYSNVQYNEEINKYPLLSRQEEYHLAMKACNGDNIAKDKLVVSNLRFVVKIARYYLNNQFYLMDLVSEGNIGLMSAIDSYQPERGYRFISYAVHWIRQSIIKAIAEKFKLVKLPLKSNNDFVRIKKQLAQYGESITDKTIDKIANDLQLKKSEALNLLQTCSHYDSLDKNISNNNNKSYSLKEALTDNRQLFHPETHTEQVSLQNCLKQLIDTLSPIERTVIVKRFGLDFLYQLDNKNFDKNESTPPEISNIGKKNTLQDIGNKFGFTKERIRQIEKKALEKLKVQAVNLDLKIYLHTSKKVL